MVGRLEKLAMMAAVVAMATFAATDAEAAASRVAVLSPSGSSIGGRLQRNVTSMSLSPVTATITACSREIVTRLLAELEADSALCADGDAIAVWVRDGDHILLKDVVVGTGADERNEEVAAARAAMLLRTGLARKDSGPVGSITIIANGPGANVVSSPLATASPPGKDAPTPAPPAQKAPRVAPRLVLGLGPSVSASRHGNSFAISAAAEIGFTRTVALVPWINFVAANRDVERPQGTASFRPTLFGLGFSMPFLGPSSVVVPRICGGYAILWMHVSPETASAPAVTRKPEDLLAPVMYLTGSVSVAVASKFRVVAEAMGGVASHEMVIRIAGAPAAQWGVPLGSLALRGEWVLP